MTLRPSFPIDPRLLPHLKPMKCQFCQSAPQTRSYHSCDFCHEWIVQDPKTFPRTERYGLITLFWYNMFEDKLRIYFEYEHEITNIYLNQFNKEYIDVDDLLLRLNFVMPITPKVLKDIPKKLKLYQVFS